MSDFLKIVGIIFVVLLLANFSMIGIQSLLEDPAPEPTTVKFECLIVDRQGETVHATLEVEQEDVITLITGDQWQFMSRMEEQ